ncbi:hypothetical protein DH2020_043589 [Rehmannia glutinosa]|uniref:LRR receptor-like serine/threonine-protein kinase n=1 Tax=Rehmannia glutinosa TaxID=99300 RepID=A0ABR0UK49_REHGL
MITPFFVLFFLMLPISFSQTLRGVFIDCGANVSSTVNGLDWLPDTSYISTGTSKIVTEQGIIPTLATVRTFPLQNNVFKKFCYEIPVDRTRKYLIRTTYYYGGVNGNDNPPVFDQIVDGTLWSVVNTTEDYVSGNLSYYEGVFMPTGKKLSVCLAANTYTDSDPFISALEVVLLWDQLYNSTDFRAYGLSLVARHNFGYDGPVIGTETASPYDFPNQVHENLAVSVSGICPSKRVPNKAGKKPRGASNVTLASISSTKLRTLLHCSLLRDSQISASRSSRTIDITINGVAYYNNLTVTPAEVFQVLPAEGKLSHVTALGRAWLLPSLVAVGGLKGPCDIIAMINLKRSFQNPPADWNGDPCLPSRYSWTGVTCSEGPRIRIVTLNLTSMGLSGSISPSIARMTALTSILLGNNSLSGTIPDLSSLRGLQNLHLEDNELGGMIPPSMGNLNNLRELFLQNNNLTGQVPSNLTRKPGLTLRYTPGNPLLTPESHNILHSIILCSVHFGGLGDGSSSRNQLILRLSSLFCSSGGPFSAFSVVFKVILLSLSACCACQKGRSLPSQNNSSAVIMFVKLPERNSKSAFRADFLSFSPSLGSFFVSVCRLGQMEMKLFSSRNSAENEMRGLEIGSTTSHLDVVWRVSGETICGDGEERQGSV